MPITAARDIETNRWKRNAKEQKQKEKKKEVNYSESVRAKWFCCVFKLGFPQRMCKASVIFKSNLELFLPIIFF